MIISGIFTKSCIINAFTNRNKYYIVNLMDARTEKNRMMGVFYQRARKNGLKITPQRAAIYEELLKAKDHPSADSIYKRIVKKIPNISFDTVNRTLLTFSKIGITNVVEGYGQPKRYDPDMDIHHHFRCIQCNSIIDFNNKEFDNITVPEEINKQFTVINKKVVLEGLCSKCRRR
jgi:Fur family transcriptional regulator, peroxide stress response regulator